MVAATKQDAFPALRRSLARLRKMNEAAVLLVVLVLMVGLTIASPYFLTPENLSTLAVGMAADGIVAVGMTVALASGGFDLSVGAVMGLSAVVAAYLYAKGASMPVAAIAALITGAAVGLANGWLISKVKISPFITTLGMMTVARGLVNVITEGMSISLDAPPAFFTWLGQGKVVGIPVIVLVFVVVAVVGDYLLRNSAKLRRVFYIGSNEKAAALSGIDVGAVQRRVYLLVAVLASVAGLMSLARFGVATPAMGDGTEMRVISAAVIGGASISGGSGTVLGSVLGVILLNVIENALVLLNVSVHWQDTISGAILIAAVAIDTLSKRRGGRPRRPLAELLAARRTR